MSRIRDIKRQLEMASEAIETLDADLAAGRLGAEEHGRQRAEREREVGRLFVSLRRGQRETGGHRAGQQPVLDRVGSGLADGPDKGLVHPRAVVGMHKFQK